MGWRRLLAAQGWGRRVARRLGLGRLLVRLGIADPLRRTLPEHAAERTERPSADAQGALLVGHPYGIHAVGEYLRASAGALAAAGVPFHIRDAFDWGQHFRDTHTDFALWDRLSNAHPYRANILFLNANEMKPLRRTLGRGFFAGRYTIACWHWELSRFPAAWRGALSGVDELWASSRFMQQALAEVARVPVRWMPHPVAVGEASTLSRAALGLPEDAYLFLTSFDLNSYLGRKNPMGAIRAFRAAFPERARPDVGLVVKMGGAGERPAEASAFRAAPELQDPRIVVLDALLERRRMVGLLARCDCFVSLHRAEGFGRVLAEAMLLGKPVVATGYSGNTDFTNERTACVVDYRLVPIGPGEYPHARGQQWAEPDLEQAAGFMRRLVEDRAWGAGLGAAARGVVEAQHGLPAVGRLYRARLRELGLVAPAAGLVATTVS